MSYWKKISDNSDLEGLSVTVKTDGQHVRDNHYTAYWSGDNQRWEFEDKNGVTCREWNGEPTHYKLIRTD